MAGRGEMFHEIPAPGFRLVSGKRAPPTSDKRYFVQARNGFADERHTYTAVQLRWKHDGSSGDIVAVKEA